MNIHAVKEIKGKKGTYKILKDGDGLEIQYTPAKIPNSPFTLNGPMRIPAGNMLLAGYMIRDHEKMIGGI